MNSVSNRNPARIDSNRRTPIERPRPERPYPMPPSIKNPGFQMPPQIGKPPPTIGGPGIGNKPPPHKPGTGWNPGDNFEPPKGKPVELNPGATPL